MVTSGMALCRIGVKSLPRLDIGSGKTCRLTALSPDGKWLSVQLTRRNRCLGFSGRHSIFIKHIFNCNAPLIQLTARVAEVHDQRRGADSPLLNDPAVRRRASPN